MGVIIKAKCKCIKEDYIFNIGAGIRDFDKAYQREIGYCNNCGKLILLEADNICQCGNAAKRIYTMDMYNEGIKEIKCPLCEDTMQLVEEGLWD